MKFVKMEGLGNDFVVLTGQPGLESAVVRRLCDRRRGVGADGVLLVGVEDGLVTMRYWNADGSDAEMCGNGLRCVARLAFDEGLAESTVFTVTTAIGPRRVEAGEVPRVELGPVTVGEQFIYSGLEFTRASVGNPHAVLTVDSVDTAPVDRLGPAIESHRRFPRRVNVGFMEIANRSQIHLRVYERGAGETLACGTGACAAVAVGRWRGRRDRATQDPLRPRSAS